MFTITKAMCLRFLKKRQVIRKVNATIRAGDKNLELVVKPESRLQDTIDPKDTLVWTDNIKHAFQAWLIEKYAPKTAQIYVSAVERVIRNYQKTAEIAVNNANSQTQAVQKFIVLLTRDSTFITANTKGHNQAKAALSAFEKFISSKEIDTTSTNDLSPSKAGNSKPVKDLDPVVIEQLTNVLSRHFHNGYRLRSPIERIRFRSKDLGKNFSLSDEELEIYIVACGTACEGKIYPVSTKTKERIKELAEEYFSAGAQAIFFAEFYAKNENWLFGASVVSEDVLKNILHKLFPKLSVTRTYFGYTDASISTVLENEILRVWGDDVLLTYNQLAERLPYIPLDKIKSALGQPGDFILSSVETFSHVSRIEITDEEREVIRATAVRECNTRGYVSITDLSSGDIKERNHELSITAIHSAIYRICLSDAFDKRGKIVTRKGDALDALTLMKEYCRTVDKCSLNDLLNYEKELTGEIHRRIPMEAGNTVLVRIDKENYVADRYVHFNTDLIDEAIELAMKGNYLPLKSFTTFGAFPDCGQTWNLFLLESYCRRFSRRFRFDTPSVNSRNAGAVIRKSCVMDYTEIMIDAVARGDVPLKNADVSRFLCDRGYTGRSMANANATKIIDQARTYREQRD